MRLLMLASLAACSTTPDADDPTAIAFGTTAIVVVVNPIINTANASTVPEPGAARAGLTLTTDDHVTATTDRDGVAVLAPVTPGARTIAIAGDGANGTFQVTVADRTLREVAIAATASTAAVMVSVDYRADQVVEVDPAMTNTEVNAILKASDRVVFFRGGTYTGDLDFAGSRVTLFGEGALGGQVELIGNVTVSGSDSRIRGTRITGTLSSQASKIGVSFSRVEGALSITGSDSMLLNNALCGTESVVGSGMIVLGNAGAAPSPSCPSR